MSADKPDGPSVTEILVWTLRKIADCDYNFTTDGPEGRWQLTIHQWESYEEEPQFSLKEADRQLFDNLPILASASGKTPEQYLEEMGEADFGWHLNLGEYLKEARVTLGSQSQSRLEIGAAEAMPESLSHGLAFAVLRDISRAFPKMVQRAELLRVLPAELPVPANVQVYLREASECFVFGRFIACLIVCRSAIESALRERLRGATEELELLIGRARRELPWTLKPTLDIADEIRIQANRAVHRAAPSANVCREMFEKTRGVLRELYTAQDPLTGIRAGADT